MATIVGSVQVDVTTGQGTFTFDDAKKKLDDFGNAAKGAGEKLDYSMREARESIILTGDALGFHLPGGISKVIASIGPLGPALVAALPVVAIVAGTVLISEHLTKLALAASKAADEMVNLGVKEEDATKGLELTGLKLDSQIAKLEGRPGKNHLAEALLETSIAADKLAESFASDFQKIDQSVIEATSITTRFGTSAWESFKALASGGLNAAVADSAIQYAAGTKKALDSLNQSYRKTQDARQAMAEAAPGSPAEAQAQAKLIESLRAYSAASKTAQQSITGDTTSEKKLYNELSQAIRGSASEIKDFAIQQANAAKQKTIGKLQDKQEDNPAVAAALEDAKKIADEQYSVAISTAKELYDQKKITLDQEVQLEHTAVQQRLKAEQDYYEGKKAIAGTTVAQIKSLSTEENIAATKAGAEDKKIDADAWKERLNVAKAAIKEIADAETKGAQESLKEATASAANASEIQKAYSAQDASAISNAEKLGTISKRQALEGSIALITQEGLIRRSQIAQELADKLTALNAEVAAEQAAAEKLLSVNGGNKADPTYRAYLDQINVLLREQGALKEKAASDGLSAQIQTNTTLGKTQTELTQLNNSWSTYFQRMKTETLDLGTAIRGNLQSAVTQFTTSFANSMAKSIVEGKNFGQAMRQVAGQILESMLSLLIQWLEKWIITHTLMAVIGNTTAAEQVAVQKAAAASIAGANGVASWALAPFPIDAGAPAFGASMAAAALAFNKGGIVPGVGNSDTVPTMLTPGESVLPQAMTEKLNNASGDGGGHKHTHIHYAPHINAKLFDGKDVKQMLTEHKNEFFKQAKQHLRQGHK